MEDVHASLWQMGTGHEARVTNRKALATKALAEKSVGDFANLQASERSLINENLNAAAEDHPKDAFERAKVKMHLREASKIYNQATGVLDDKLREISNVLHEKQEMRPLEAPPFVGPRVEEVSEEGEEGEVPYKGSIAPMSLPSAEQALSRLRLAVEALEHTDGLLQTMYPVHKFDEYPQTREQRDKLHSAAMDALGAAELAGVPQETLDEMHAKIEGCRPR